MTGQPADRQLVDRVVDALRRGGGRATVGRRAVVEALVEATGHVRAEDIVARVQEWHPDVHASTVYRALDALEAAGLVAHTHIGHGAAVWHLADDDRLHLACDGCGAVVHIPPGLFDQVEASLRRDFGFEASLAHVAVPGRCRACQQAAGR
jgi:Fur family transcriptional regulator, ferric uptake regulator